MTLQLTDSQKALLTVAFTTAKGKPANIDGAPTWSISDETIATVVPASDGLTAEVTALQMGSASVSVTADADLGAGVKTIAGFLDLVVVSAEAAVVEITAGTPEAQ